jgi:hypothetical protein
MDKIVDGVYLGDIRAASNLFLLKSNVCVIIVTFTFLIEYYPRLASDIGAEPVLPRCK